MENEGKKQKPTSLFGKALLIKDFLLNKRHKIFKVLLYILVGYICWILGNTVWPYFKFAIEKEEIYFVIDSFMDAVQDKNTSEAYSLFPCRIQRRLPLFEFEEKLTSDIHDLFDGYTGIRIKLPNSFIGEVFSSFSSLPTGKIATAYGTIIYENGSTGDFKAILEDEEDTWRLFFLGIEKEANRGYVVNAYPQDREYYGTGEEEFATRNVETFFPQLSELTPITQVSSVDGMVQVYVPAGEFKMGDSCPPHIVYLDAYWIDQTEVTNAMFAGFLNAQGDQLQSWMPRVTFNQFPLLEIIEGQWIAMPPYMYNPVVWVNWYAAKAYCEWAGRRLPTEAEWEKAARGTDGRHYPWGEGYDCSVAQYSSCGRYTEPVGSFLDGASPYGALDMAGNVWEWVLDWADTDYYSYSPTVNPQGPSSGEVRVLRGGSWNDVGWEINSNLRYWRYPDDLGEYIGVRCAQSP